MDAVAVPPAQTQQKSKFFNVQTTNKLPPGSKTSGLCRDVIGPPCNTKGLRLFAPNRNSMFIVPNAWRPLAQQLEIFNFTCASLELLTDYAGL